MIWSDEKAQIGSLVGKVEVSNIWIIVLIVSGFSVWLVFSVFLKDMLDELNLTNGFTTIV